MAHKKFLYAKHVVVIVVLFLVHAAHVHAARLVLVEHCVAHEVPVYVTYAIIDTIGPGFGSQVVDRERQLATVIRPACFAPEEKRISAWRYGAPSDVFAHDGADVEQIPEILDEFYQISAKKDAIIFEANDRITVPGGEVVSTSDMQLYYDRQKKRAKSRTMIAHK